MCFLSCGCKLNIFLYLVTLPFLINPDTGYINISSSLDREQQAKYVLTVEVSFVITFVIISFQ